MPLIDGLPLPLQTLRFLGNWRFQHRLAQQVATLHSISLHIEQQRFRITGPIVRGPQFFEYFVETAMLLLHLLVVAATLLCLSCADELLHSFEDFVGASHVAVEEVAAVQFQEPVVSLVLFQLPVPSLPPFP